MLARLSIDLPYNIAIKQHEPFPLYEYETYGYKVRNLPPAYTEEREVTAPDELRMNDEPAILANILRIDFEKNNFNRERDGDIDPPIPIINYAVNSFIIRLRHVANASHVHTTTLPKGNWRIEYTNNDGSPLEKNSTLVRGRGGATILKFDMVGLTSEIWTRVHELPSDYAPPAWEILLLDAQAQLPNVGTAVVLAASALEVFIAPVLDTLAKEHVTPAGLWEWVNNRNDHRLEPSAKEQYDVLLRLLAGHSLKEERTLWDGFSNLRDARNAFVHEGTATIGKTTVDPERAAELVTTAGAIINKIRDWLPEHLRWPNHLVSVTFKMSKRIATSSNEDKHVTATGASVREEQEDRP
jgi:hypothetical protein